MADYDVAVIGGGPAGYAAALKAAEGGASVVLIEAEKPGGACVHYSCIPTNILLSAATTHLEARELAALGVFEAGDRLNLGRSAARKDTLIRMIAAGITAALKMRKVAVVSGRAAFRDARSLTVLGPEGERTVSAEAFIIATGTRWEPPSFPGVVAERVLTADGVQALAAAPASALVLGDGPAQTAFGLEYACLLAAAGSSVTYATGAPQLVPGLDADVAEVAASLAGDLGIQVMLGCSVDSGEGNQVLLRSSGGARRVDAEVVVTADVRRPYFGTLNLPAIGVDTSDRIPVGRDCRTSVPHIFAAGDVTGGVMLTSVATQMGEVAAVNALGGNAHTRLTGIPHILHTVPEIGWVGITEAEARSRGAQVRCGVSDLAYNARAVALGARRGILKIVVEPSLGEILGVHAVGPGAVEMISVAAALMQSEVPVQDLAAMTPWHPSMTESLIEAARRTL